MRTCFLTFVIVFFSSIGLDAREWVDATGKHRIEAELIAVRGDKVVLEKKDGSVTSVPIAQLSLKDREFIGQQASAPKQPMKDDVPKTSESESATEPLSQGLDATVANGKDAVADPRLVELATQAKSLLQTHCYRCHGEDQSNEGGFGFATDREKLVSAGYVIPKNAAHSPLIERMKSKDSPMPPEGESPRPTDDEIATIQEWIQTGAVAETQGPRRVFISTQEVYRTVANDLKKLSERDREFARYFSVVHLANAGFSSAEIDTYKIALAKLINSLSWNRQLAQLHPVAKQPFVFRIDLRDAKWSNQMWDTIVASYPHALIVESRDAHNLRTATQCDIPLIRADWFVAQASRPPLYHELAQIPSTDTQLEALLQVDVAKNLEQDRAQRVGFARSGVSQHNRLLERHDSIFGAYWKSYDFAGSSGQKNLFEYPLGPGPSAGTFAHDGGEIIFHLPNGMLGFMLVDDQGRRIDRGPIEIVSDPRQPDRTVVNGVSCMSCHYGGFIQKSDEIRAHITANAQAYNDPAEAARLYADPASINARYIDDSKLYTTALAKSEIGITKPTQAGEPIVLIGNRYVGEVDLTMAAAELGMEPAAFADALSNIQAAELNRTIGVLKTSGGVIKRDAFDQLFIELATHLGLGSRGSTEPGQARSTAKANTNKRAPIAMNGKTAADAIRAGMDAMKNQQWQEAEDFFAAALKLTNDRVLRARIYEQAIPLYERGESIETLLQAHLQVLDICDNTTAIDLARTHFFNSVERFINKSHSWTTSGTKSDSLRWNTAIPASVAAAITSAFEQKLTETPDHEPSLRVMQLFWKHVQDNSRKRMEVVGKLRDILSKRKELLTIPESADLAEQFVLNGDPSKGADVYDEIANQVDGARAGFFRLQEGEAWSKAQQKDKALVALKRAAKDLVKSRDSSTTHNLTRLGDLYLTVEEPSLAQEAYRDALKGEKNAYQVQQLQEKIANIRGGDEQPANKMAMSDADDLLDPSRPFRMQAEEAEKSAKSNVSQMFYYMTTAAQNWIDANDAKRAEAALRKAAATLKRSSGTSAESDNAKLAELFQRINLNQDAVDHYLAALRLADYDFTIGQYQEKIESLMQTDTTIKLTPEQATLVDPRYRFSIQAKKTEETKTFDVNSQAMTLVQAAKQWSDAEKAAEVKRVGLKAETAIKQIPSESTGYLVENYARDLADAYSKVKLHEDAIRVYLLAIDYARDDAKARSYFQQVESICQANQLKVPELSADTALKLDPLNRYRVDARKYEQEAKETSSQFLSAKSDYRRAIENWLKAKETEEAVRVAKDLSQLLTKSSEARDSDFEWLAEQLEKIEQPKLARELYELAMERTKYDHKKEMYRKRIEILK